MHQITVAGRDIGHGAPCFIIAEAGVNHNGDVELARRLIEIAASSGADAVKFQTFSARRLAAVSAPKAAYQKRSAEEGESQFEMLERLELPYEAHAMLQAYCREKKMVFLSTPFDEIDADFLRSIDVPAFKTPSGELTNHRYLRHIAAFGRPMIVSTGMATLAEVDAAAAVLNESNAAFALLHCVSNYPAAPETANLRAMNTLKRAFCVPVGYSDHTEGVDIALASVALGASIIEKHFTFDTSAPGPDHAASLMPSELRSLILSVRRVEQALGDGRKRPALPEAATADVARKSCVAARNIAAGEKLQPLDVVLMRPGTGIAPTFLDAVVGRTAIADIPKGTILQWDLFQ